MTRIVLAFALLALLASAADPTPSTVSLTSGSFAAAPGSKVIDATTTTAADYASWYLYDTATFGPGAANTTLYAYGFDSSATALTKVISRALNATLLSNGTAATAVTDAKIGTDGVWAAGLTLTSSPKWGVGLGSVGIAYVAADTATVPCRQVYLAVLNGGGSSPIVTKQVTSNVCTKCTQGTAGTGTGYTISIGNVYYDNATYWVSYTQNLYTETETNPTQTACTAAPVATSGTTVVLTSVKSNLNGVAATSTGTLAYTAATELFSGTAALTADPQCGPSNYTNSTNIYCVYKDAATSKNLVLQPVTMSSGAKGTSVTIATDATTGTTGNADNVVKVFTFAGFVASQYQQGILINNNTGTGATLAYTNNLNFYNTTSGAATQTAGGAIVGSTYTTSIQSGVFSGAGIPWGSGYAIVDGYLSSTTTTPSTYTYEYGSFLSNSTVNVSKTTIGTVQGANLASYFVDANGAFWFGAVTLDTTAGGVTSASIGKLVDQLYSAGNILASFFALISLMIAALFAF